MTILNKADYELLEYIEKHPKVHKDKIYRNLNESQLIIDGRISLLKSEKLIWSDMDVYECGNITRFASTNQYSITAAGAKVLADFKLSKPSITDLIAESNILKILSFLKSLIGIVAIIYFL